MNSKVMNVKNYKIYSISILVSLLFILTPLICNTVLTTILSGIGCSGIAAAVMAVFLEMAEEQRNVDKKKRARRLYFNKLNQQLIMLLERTLWFAERLKDDDFDWGLDTEVYGDYNYIRCMNKRYSEEVISFEEAKVRLKELAKEYDVESLRYLKCEDKQNIAKMFRILAVSTDFLLNETNAVRNDKLLLEVEEYLSVNDLNVLMYDITYAIEIMQQDILNKGAAIDALLRASTRVRTIGEYKDNIRIALHKSYRMTDLQNIVTAESLC